MMNYDKMDYIKINGMIMNVAVRGNCECIGEIDIDWNVVGGYVFALIKEYTGKWWYRLFKTNDEYCFDEKTILYTLDHDDDPLYIYGYYENIETNDKVLKKNNQKESLQDVINVISHELSD